MLIIRLQRIGKKGQAYFRVVVMEHTKKTKGEFLELLGTYNPHQKEFKVDRERAEYWLSKGSQISPTVNNLMVNYKVWDRPKMASWKPKKRKAPSDMPIEQEGKPQVASAEQSQSPTEQASQEPAPAEPATPQ